MKKLFLIIFFIFLELKGWSQKRQVDSLINYIGNSKVDSLKFEAMCKLSGINQSNGEEQSTQGKGRREKLFCPFCGGTNITDTHKSMYACQNCSKGWEK
jgi:ribosomal protein S27AE